MAHVAVAVARTAGGWSAFDVDLSEVEDLDAAADLLRGDADGATVVLYVEENDEWFGVVRVDDTIDDTRVFLSDRRVVESSDLAHRIFEDALPAAAPVNEEDDDESVRPVIEPAGDPDLLADLGVSPDRLVELTAEEGLLPADVIAALAEATGAGEALEALRVL